jgi:hypothetical protein
VPVLDEENFFLSTIHSAKGQEWKSVFGLNVVDGALLLDLRRGYLNVSSRTAKMRRAIATSMDLGPASSQMAFSACSTWIVEHAPMSALSQKAHGAT